MCHWPLKSNGANYIIKEPVVRLASLFIPSRRNKLPKRITPPLYVRLHRWHICFISHLMRVCLSTCTLDLTFHFSKEARTAKRLLSKENPFTPTLFLCSTPCSEDGCECVMSNMASPAFSFSPSSSSSSLPSYHCCYYLHS